MYVKLYEVLNKFEILKKLTNLVTMTLQDLNGRMKIQRKLTKAFGIEKG